MTVLPSLSDQEIQVAAYYKTFADQLKTAKSRVASPNASKVDAVLASELTPAFLGKTTVREALNNAAAQIDDLLSAGN
jgi:multiple sugar transport system substrate-binding protein